ncbi:CmpA/NrtA family ABC transporter substrate-binding protein [Rhodanobacter caeni]|uniref:CmpA/NrtA family ABC transporter substrate-binding protein n=1 Tax=Rhodanobacter caeni TaxID=657654 RepID=UPI0031E401F8
MNAPTPTPREAAPRLRIGLLRLTDSAPVVTAYEFGFFAEEGVDVELVIEPSSANIADKLAFGALDAAAIAPPLAFAVQLGLRGVARPMVIPYSLGVGGVAITLAIDLARQVRARGERDDLDALPALAACLRGQPLTLGVAPTFSAHNLLFRYWLGSVGIEPGRDVKLVVVPPSRAVEALREKEIAGFCAGAPWGEVARRNGVGLAVAGTQQIWGHAPEKAFAMCAGWADRNPAAMAGVLRALHRSSRFCDNPENGAYIASLLSRRRYLNLGAHTILATLPGGAEAAHGCVFHRGAATFPWRSQGLWFLGQMRRWHLIDDSIDLATLAERVYRPDLYRAALSPVGASVPLADWKVEGAHATGWSLDALPAPMAMPADRFCDGAIFDPAAVPPLGESAMRIRARDDGHDAAR